MPLDNEFQVSNSKFNGTYLSGRTLSDVAMDANDDFVIVWEGDFESSAWGVYGDYFTATNAVRNRATDSGTNPAPCA